MRALVLAALLPVAAMSAPARRPVDWSRVAARTPGGGMVLGNPKARARLVEYLSFTCPHCAVFEKTAVPKLIAKYVKPGRVALEQRIALRDPFDLAAATLARCDGPKRFFALAPAIFAAQEAWIAQGYRWQQSNPDLTKLNEADAGRAVMRGAGLDALMAANGMTAARASQCMANVADQKLMSDRAQAIWNRPGFPGTPAFEIGGRLRTDIRDWPTLDAALRR